MKKILVVLLAVLMVLGLAACGTGDTNLLGPRYDRVHMNGAEGKCVVIKAYRVSDNSEFQDGHAEVTLEDGTHLYLSAGTYFLVEVGGKCPFCD